VLYRHGPADLESMQNHIGIDQHGLACYASTLTSRLTGPPDTLHAVLFLPVPVHICLVPHTPNSRDGLRLANLVQRIKILRILLR